MPKRAVTFKGCDFMKTAGQWSWKSKSAKKRVTTYLPNELAPKIDGKQPHHSAGGILALQGLVGRRVDCDEGFQ